MNKQTVMGIGAGLAILICGVSLIRRALREDTDLPGTVGRGVAEAAYQETATVVGGKGSIVVVQFTCEWCPQETELQATYDRLIEDDRRIQVLGRLEVPLTDDPHLPAKIYAQAVSLHPEADAVVSLVGLPRGKLPAAETKLLAVVLNGNRLRAKWLFEKGALDRAILPRTAPPENGPALPKTAGEMFAFNYEVVTPDQAGAIVD